MPFYEDWEDEENWDEWGDWGTYSGYEFDETTTAAKTTTTAKKTEKTTTTTEKTTQNTTKKTTTAANNKIHEDGSYYTKNDVALYIHTYGHLPDNFITKNEARDLGWNGGSVEKYAKGKAIGGDRFGNYEGTLPRKKGRYYTECDIDTYGKKSRGAKRIVFSNDGLIYYTDDHYETFELLYGNEGD
ncbi:MAG: ribonuclease [Ruminococcaceae bacterium]|nr:ribonuclease [Oscillospiraceae bacterium]